jgi:hypothetical protein
MNGENLNKIKAYINQETSHIQDFIQEYVNEQGMHYIRRMYNLSTTPTEMMDGADWFIRNIEFVSPKLFN